MPSRSSPSSGKKPAKKKIRSCLRDDEQDSDFEPSDSETITEESSSSSEDDSTASEDEVVVVGVKKGASRKKAKKEEASTRERKGGPGRGGGGGGRGRGRGRGRGGAGGGDSGSAAPGPLDVTYLTEMSNGKATCRKCEVKVPKDEIRIGLRMNSGRFGITTRWQHLKCTIFKKIESVNDIEGYEFLEVQHQALVQPRFEESANEVDEDTQAIDPAELVRKEWSQAMDPPSTLVLPILPYQKEGLGWMYKQEQSEYHGGILADEMGMGKTIQAISLMLANRPGPEHVSDWNKSDTSHGHTINHRMRAGTLVICPLIALLQWQSEIAKFTSLGSLKVIVYHGSSREDVKAALQQADVVLTTYSIVESEFRKMTSPEKVKCEDCGKRFYPDKLRLHKKYFCGEGAALTAAQARTQRKRKVNVGSLSKKTMRANAATKGATTPKKKKFPDEEETLSSSSSSDDESDTEGSSDSESDSSSEEEDEDDVKKGKKGGGGLVKRKGGGAAAVSKKKQAPVAVAKKGGDKYAEIKARNKKLMAKHIKETEGKGNGAAAKKMTATVSKGKKGAKDVIDIASSSSSGSSSSGSSDSDRSSISGSDSESDVEEKKYTKIKKKMVELSKGGRGGGGRGGRGGRGGGRGRGRGGGRAKSPRNGDGEGSEYEGSEASEDDDPSSSSSSSSSDSDDAEDRKPGAKKKAERSIIHDMSWFRIILDEAHYVKTRSTSTAKAVFALTSLNKWCLTGTPLQNRVGELNFLVRFLPMDPHASDYFCRTKNSTYLTNYLPTYNRIVSNRVGELYSLVRFLRMDPHAYYFCRIKNCTCKSLHYKFGKNWDSCESCGHTPMFHFAHFNRNVLNPIQRAGYIGEGRKAMLTLKNEILDPVLLRRTKDTRSEDIMLPPRLVKLRQDKMDEREEDFYQALYTQSQAQFNTYLQSGTVLNNYAHIFDILIRLRQAVDHPYLVIHSNARAGDGTRGGTSGPIAAAAAAMEIDDDQAANGNVNGIKVEGADDDDEEHEEEECGLCHEEIEDTVRAECGCGFCRLCVTEYIESSINGASKCPKCSEPLTVDLSKSGGQGEEGDGKAASSTFTIKKTRSGSSSNKAGTVCVAGKLKLQGIDRKSILHKIQLENFQSSTKLEALLEELHIMQARDPSAKAIVFSQFVNMLDLIMWRLTAEGINCHKLSGHMSVGARDKVLRAFKEDADCKVLLISLKAGGVALNLTHANHIFLMDPWWNPAAEMQAIDRTHRIGQYKPIFATRLIVEDSIEERILKLQDKKQLVFDGTVGGDAGSLARLTVDDLRFLFTSN